MEVIQTPVSGTRAGWTYSIPRGKYTLTKDLELYLGYYQTMRDGSKSNGNFLFPQGTVIQSHGSNGIGCYEYGVYITSFETDLQKILDNSIFSLTS